jgi:hypothetical protein
MAIIPSLPGISVSVLVGGATAPPAQEYNDPAPPASSPEANGQPVHGVCSRYIESQDGADFAFRFEAGNKAAYLGKNNALAFDISIDGKRVNGVLFRRDQRHRPQITDNFTYIDDVTGDARCDKFGFAPISTLDDASKERTKTDAQRTKSMGVLSIKLYQATTDGSMLPPSRGTYADGQDQLSEKALKGKAIDHNVAFSSTVVKRAPDLVSCKYHSPPLAEFCFRYRSMNGLYNEGIVPRPRSPSPENELSSTGGGGDINTLSLDELRRLAAERLAQLDPKQDNKKDIRRGIKREHGGENGIIDVDALDARRSSKKRKVTIDLTGD